MIDTLLTEGITKALYDAFKVPVYLEWKENKMKFPCFLVSVADSNHDLHVSKLYNRKLDYTVKYFLNAESIPVDYRKDLLQIGEELYDILEYVKVGDRITRGEGMKYNENDGVLHFSVTYEMLLHKESKKDPAMERLKVIERSSKNG